jgi:membrane protein
MKKSASLAYYTVFSIGPLLMIVIWVLDFSMENIFKVDLQRKIRCWRKSWFFGQDVTTQIQSYLQKITFENKSNMGITIGIVTLILSSTTLFVDIQDSINNI